MPGLFFVSDHPPAGMIEEERAARVQRRLDEKNKRRMAWLMGD